MILKRFYLEKRKFIKKNILLPYRNILSRIISRWTRRLWYDCDNWRWRIRPCGLGVFEARQGQIVRNEKTQKTAYCRHATTRTRVQRENHPRIVFQSVYWQVSLPIRWSVGKTSHRRPLEYHLSNQYRSLDLFSGVKKKGGIQALTIVSRLLSLLSMCYRGWKRSCTRFCHESSIGNTGSFSHRYKRYVLFLSLRRLLTCT